MRNDTQRTDLFIEKRLPVQTLNEQVYYEHGGNPFKGLHRWYSRKPLSFSRASVLASLLPGDVSMEEFEDLLGLQPGKEVKLYKTPPTPELIKKVQGYCLEVWGNPTPRILDAFAGGGSIPFEAVRYGLNVLASDLNPVAVVTMKAAIEYPLKFGPDLQDDIDKWVKWVGDETEKRLTEFFPSLPGETVQNYLWAHTIVCPHCESIIPLSPNWWLYKRPEKQNLHKWCAIKPIPNPENKRIDFELIKGTKGKGTTIQTDDGQYDPDTITTIARGVGKCLNCGNIIEDNVIKSQAQTQGLGYQLYAIAYKKGQNSLEFRTPQDIDLDGIEKSGNNLNVVSERYHSNTYPQEQVVFGDKTKELIRYGIDNWSKLFNPRQLLTLATYVEIINEAKNLIYQEYQKQKQEKITKLQTEGQTELQPNLTAELELFYQTKYEAISTYLTLVLDRCADRNCRLSMWDSSRGGARTGSALHSLNLMWNYPEISGVKELWFSCADAFTSDYQTLCTYLGTTLGTNQNYGIEIHDSKSIQIKLASADNLTYIPDNSIHAIITDPPYYSTIQYAELSDFFYVWQKRILGDIFPELFYLELTDKEQEAVANPSRFRNMGISPEELANQDYEAKMSMAFAEYHRVLHKHGVMTVQFNHKDSGAWDVLAKSLIEAGFEITASWSVSTENPQNLHQAQKNAVSSTVLLVCRKRPPHAEQGWWDDVRLELRNTILTKAPEIERSLVADSRPAPDRVQDPRVRIKPPGIDLCLTAYGSALSVFTRYTSILDSSGVRVEPKAAFEEVRQAIVSYRLERLLAGKDFYGVDSLTQWYILAWDTFEAREFPFDEARQLALAVGGFDVSDLVKKYKLLDSTSGFCKLLTPEQRLKKRAFSVVETEFSGLNLVDGIHAIICIYQTEQKIEFVRKFLKNTELVSKDAFMKTFELVLKVIPQIKDESKRIIEEKVLLDLWLAMDEIKAKVSYQQMELLSNPSATDDHPNQMSLF